MVDVRITGQGFYSITGVSDAGREWLDMNVDGNASDDTRYTQDIADAATMDGLTVSANGRLYLMGGGAGDHIE